MAMADNKKTEAGKPIAASTDPPAEEARKGALPGKWTKNDLGMPVEDPCPVVPLGREGAYYHMMDSAGQFRSFTASDFSHSGIQDLFARAPNWPKWCWPRYGRAPAAKDGEAAKPPPIKSFQDDDIREMLMKACSDVGLFSPTDKLRGRGAWSLRGGGLIYHAGEELWAARCVDPVLLLGWIGVAYLGGALDWRSAVLLLGDKGTGKSTLQDGLKLIFGEALFHSSDTTAAGIYQRMKHDTRPVALDELEPGADGRKVDNVVQLMRDASSGAIGRRGSLGRRRRRIPDALGVFVLGDQQSAAPGAGSVARRDVAAAAARADMQPRPAIDADTCGRMILAILMREWPNFPGRLEGYARRWQPAATTRAARTPTARCSRPPI
jgi:hypothetical protein